MGLGGRKHQSSTKSMARYSRSSPGGAVSSGCFRTGNCLLADRLDGARRGWLVLPRVLLAIRPLAGIGFRRAASASARPLRRRDGGAGMVQALEAVRRCDCMIQVGTSGTVMPAAMLPMETKAAGAKVITIDPTAAKEMSGSRARRRSCCRTGRGRRSARQGWLAERPSILGLARQGHMGTNRRRGNASKAACLDWRWRRLGCPVRGATR